MCCLSFQVHCHFPSFPCLSTPHCISKESVALGPYAKAEVSSPWGMWSTDTVVWIITIMLFPLSNHTTIPATRRSTWYRSLRIELMDSPGVVMTGRLLKGTGWQVVWVAHWWDHSHSRNHTLCCFSRTYCRRLGLPYPFAYQLRTGQECIFREAPTPRWGTIPECHSCGRWWTLVDAGAHFVCTFLIINMFCSVDE